MCIHCDPGVDCAHDRAGDVWLTPADLRRPAAASVSGTLAPADDPQAPGDPSARESASEAVLRRDGGR